MNKIDLIYNFDHFYGSGMNTFIVFKPNFKYTITLTEEDKNLSLEELTNKYWLEAFEAAAYEYTLDNPWVLKDPYEF